MKKFTYQLSIDGIEYTPETAKAMFGDQAGYNPDFHADSFSREVIEQLFKDAISHCLMAQLKYIATFSQESGSEDIPVEETQFYKYLDGKVKAYEALRDSLICVKSVDCDLPASAE